MIVITAGHIDQLRTERGGFNEETMRLFGMWPLTEGWQRQMIGLKVSDRTWKEAIRARGRARHVFRGNTRRQA